jgi:hypothetical protein
MRKKKQNILLSVLLFAMIALVPCAVADEFYLVPQDSSAPCTGSVDVELWLDNSVAIAGYQLNVEFNSMITNLSDVTFITSGTDAWGWHGNYVTIISSGSPLIGSSGSTHLANLTVDCLGVDDISYLNFSSTMLSDTNGDPVTHTATNGTCNCICAALPDLVVKQIDPRYQIFKDLTNVFTVYIENQGAGDAGSCEVSLQWNDSTGVLHDIEPPKTVSGLLSGANTTVTFQGIPLSDPMSNDINVTAIIDWDGQVPESDESNNVTSNVYTAGSGYRPESHWGYGGNEPLEQFKQDGITGDLFYTFGDSQYLTGYHNNWTTYTANFSDQYYDEISNSLKSINGPVKEARLYLYYNWFRTPDNGRLPSVTSYLTMDFNAANNIPFDKHYEDCKGFAYSGTYKYGTIAYNVTNLVTQGDTYYDAVLTNSGETTGDDHHVAIYGMALLVIYEDSSVNPKEYCIYEGHDILRQYYKSGTTGRYSYYVIPEDATSTFDMCSMSGDADFFSVTADVDLGTDYSRLYFDDPSYMWSSPWPYQTQIKMGTFTSSVNLANPNTVKFQDRGDGFGATNAILIKDQGSKIDLGPNQITEEGRQITIPITAYDVGQFYGAVEMNLSFNPTKFQFVRVDSTPDSLVYASNDYPGIVDISAMNDDGIKGNITLAEVVFEVTGGKGTCSEFNLTVDLLRDIYYANIPNYDVPTEICIEDPAGLKVNWATAHPQGLLGGAILNTNGRPRHSGDDEVLIKANILDSGLGIQDVRVDLTSIGGGSNVHMTGPYPNAGNYQYIATADDGIDALHDFIVTAEDNGGNLAHNTTNSFYVWRRGDTVKDNVVNIIDAYNIAQYTVGLFTPSTPAEQNRFDFRGDVQPACDGDYTTNMVDALYIARYGLTLEPAP